MDFRGYFYFNEGVLRMTRELSVDQFVDENPRNVIGYHAQFTSSRPLNVGYDYPLKSGKNWVLHVGTFQQALDRVAFLSVMEADVFNLTDTPPQEMAKNVKDGTAVEMPGIRIYQLVLTPKLAPIPHEDDHGEVFSKRSASSRLKSMKSAYNTDTIAYSNRHEGRPDKIEVKNISVYTGEPSKVVSIVNLKHEFPFFSEKFLSLLKRYSPTSFKTEHQRKFWNWYEEVVKELKTA